MKVRPIHDKFGKHPNNLKYKKEISQKHYHPIDSIAFDRVELSGNGSSEKPSNQWLISHIRSLPDDLVNTRIRKLNDSFDTIDDCLAEKLISGDL